MKNFTKLFFRTTYKRLKKKETLLLGMVSFIIPFMIFLPAVIVWYLLKTGIINV